MSDTPARSALVPDQMGQRQPAEILNAVKKPVILAGQGALEATNELEQTANPAPLESHATLEAPQSWKRFHVSI